MDIPDAVTNAISTADTWIWYIGFLFLVGFGIYATFRSKVVQVSHLKEACRVTFTGIKEKKHRKSISSFQAFCVSMGARIGVGNIAGVAAAIVMGGPGSIFWMWIFAIIGAATSFVENTIGQIYKEKKEDGIFYGGPAYYVKNGLGKPKLAVFMAALIILTYGLCFTGVQANQAYFSLQEVFDGVLEMPLIGGVTILNLIIGASLALLAAVIVFGGNKRIASVSTWLVPTMAVIWMILTLAILIVNISHLGEVVATIFSYAFGIQAFVGGGIGTAIMWGLKRGIFTNEAGIGSIPNISSSADVSHPVRQGLMQSLGVLFVTLVICTLTAFVVILYTNQVYPAYDFAIQNLTDALAGAPLVAAAFSSTFLGAAAPIILSLFLVIFAFSSLITYSSISETNIRFITQKKWPITLLRIVIVAMVFFSAIWSMTLAWGIANIFQALMAIFNIGVIIFLAKHAWSALKDYFAQKAAGIKEPVFDAKVLSSQKGVTCWPATINNDTDEEKKV